MKILKIFCLTIACAVIWSGSGDAEMLQGVTTTHPGKPICQDGKPAVWHLGTNCAPKKRGGPTCMVVGRGYWTCDGKKMSSSQPFDCEKSCPSDHSKLAGKKNKGNRKQCRKHNCAGWETAKTESKCRNLKCKSDEECKLVGGQVTHLPCEKTKEGFRICPEAKASGTTGGGTAVIRPSTYKCVKKGPPNFPRVGGRGTYPGSSK